MVKSFAIWSMQTFTKRSNPMNSIWIKIKIFWLPIYISKVNDVSNEIFLECAEIRLIEKSELKWTLLSLTKRWQAGYHLHVLRCKTVIHAVIRGIAVIWEKEQFCLFRVYRSIHLTGSRILWLEPEPRIIPVQRLFVEFLQFLYYPLIGILIHHQRLQPQYQLAWSQMLSHVVKWRLLSVEFQKVHFERKWSRKYRSKHIFTRKGSDWNSAGIASHYVGWSRVAFHGRISNGTPGS